MHYCWYCCPAFEWLAGGSLCEINVASIALAFRALVRIFAAMPATIGIAMDGCIGHGGVDDRGQMLMQSEAARIAGLAD
jgi:hypothetical protein